MALVTMSVECTQVCRITLPSSNENNSISTKKLALLKEMWNWEQMIAFNYQFKGLRSSIYFTHVYLILLASSLCSILLYTSSLISKAIVHHFLSCFPPTGPSLSWSLPLHRCSVISWTYVFKITFIRQALLYLYQTDQWHKRSQDQ